MKVSSHLNGVGNLVFLIGLIAVSVFAILAAAENLAWWMTGLVAGVVLMFWGGALSAAAKKLKDNGL